MNLIILIARTREGKERRIKERECETHTPSHTQTHTHTHTHIQKEQKNMKDFICMLKEVSLRENKFKSRQQQISANTKKFPPRYKVLLHCF